MNQRRSNADPDSVDLSSGSRAGADKFESDGRTIGRPWLQVLFRCSGHYQRVYRSVDGSSYNARCPRCGKQVRFRVGPGGTGERFFEVHCGR